MKVDKIIKNAKIFTADKTLQRTKQIQRQQLWQ